MPLFKQAFRIGIAALLVLTTLSSTAHSLLRFTKLVDTNTSIPGGTGAFMDLGIGSGRAPTLDQGTVAFFGTGSAGQLGIYLVAAGAISRIVDATTTIPGVGTAFIDLPAFSLDEGVVAFSGLGATSTGIYSGDGIGAVLRIADNTTLIPPALANAFESLDTPSIAGGEIVFRGANSVSSETGLYSSLGGVLTRFVDQTSVIPGEGVTFTDFSEPQTDGTTVAFLGSNLSQGLYGVYTYSGGSITTIADQSVFSSFSSPMPNGAAVAFISNDIHQLPGGVLVDHTLLRPGPLDCMPSVDESPGYIALNNVAYGQLISTSVDREQVAFACDSGSGAGGVYAHFDEWRWRIVDTDNTMLDGKSVIEVLMGREGLSQGQVVFAVKFHDNTQAIYRVDLGEPGTEVTHEIASPGIQESPDFWVEEWDFEGCDVSGWTTADVSKAGFGDWARLFPGITDNDVCTENTSCAWLFTDHTTPTTACDVLESYAPDMYTLESSTDNVIVSPWLTNVAPLAETVLRFDVFGGNGYRDGRMVLGIDVRRRGEAYCLLSLPSATHRYQTLWKNVGWMSLSNWSWKPVEVDISPYVLGNPVPEGWLMIEPWQTITHQVRFRVANWGPDGLDCAASGGGCGPGAGPFIDNIRIGKNAATGPALDPGIDCRSQAQDAFPTELDNSFPGEHHRPTMDRFGTVAFSRGGDLGICGMTNAVVTGDSIHMRVTDMGNGVDWVEIWAAIVEGPHEGKVPGPYNTHGEFFRVPAQNARTAQGDVIDDMYFVDLSDDYFRGGDKLVYFWMAQDDNGGMSTDPPGLAAAPNLIDDAVTATGGLHEVSFLPTIHWDPAYLARIQADDFGDVAPTDNELANSAQQNCILYVQSSNGCRRSNVINRTAFMFYLDQLGYRGQYDVYDQSGIGNTNNQLAGRATIEQASGYSLIIHDAGLRRTATLPDGSDLDSDKLDQGAWYQTWLAQANVSEPGVATLWILGAAIAEEYRNSPLITQEMGASVLPVGSCPSDPTDPIEGVADFTFSTGNTAAFSVLGDYSLSSCPRKGCVHTLAASGGVATHTYSSGAGAAIIMNSNPAMGWNTILQAHPIFGISSTTGAKGQLIDPILNAVLTGSCIGSGISTTTLERVPVQTALHSNVPNPFNPTTTIRFDLAEGGFVELDIYDVAGRHVRRLVRASKEAGHHNVVWNGRDDRGKAVGSGIYLYRMHTERFEQSRRLVLVR